MRCHSLPVIESDCDSEIGAEMRRRINVTNLADVGQPRVHCNPPVDQAVVLGGMTGLFVSDGEEYEGIFHENVAIISFRA